MPVCWRLYYTSWPGVVLTRLVLPSQSRSQHLASPPHNFIILSNCSLWIRMTRLFRFYATETYIMHFLEPAWFLNALDLAGRKVNVLYDPGLAEKPPPLQLFTYLWVFGPWNNHTVLVCIKLPMNLLIIWRGPLWFWCGAKTLQVMSLPCSKIIWGMRHMKTGSLVILCKWEQSGCFRAQTPTSGRKHQQRGVKYIYFTPR